MPVKKQACKARESDFKKRKIYPHTTLPFASSCYSDVFIGQKMFIGSSIILLIAGLIFRLIPTLQIIVAFLSALYFIDTLFNLFMIFRSLRKREEITVSQEALEAVDETTLPVYSILCPLYIKKLMWCRNL